MAQFRTIQNVSTATSTFSQWAQVVRLTNSTAGGGTHTLPAVTSSSGLIGPGYRIAVVTASGVTSTTITLQPNGADTGYKIEGASSIDVNVAANGAIVTYYGDGQWGVTSAIPVDFLVFLQTTLGDGFDGIVTSINNVDPYKGVASDLLEYRQSRLFLRGQSSAVPFIKYVHQPYDSTNFANAQGASVNRVVSEENISTGQTSFDLYLQRRFASDGWDIGGIHMIEYIIMVHEESTTPPTKYLVQQGYAIAEVDNPVGASVVLKQAEWIIEDTGDFEITLRPTSFVVNRAAYQIELENNSGGTCVLTASFREVATMNLVV